MNNRNEIWIVLIILLLVFLFVGPFMFMGPMMGPGMMGGWHMGQGMMGYGYGFNWFGAIIRLLFFLVFIGLIIFGVHYLVSGNRVKPSTGSTEISKPSDRSLEILKERYAKGEISTEEFQKMKKEIK